MNGTIALAKAALPTRPSNPQVRAAPWRPPFDAARLQRVLESARQWEPVDWKQVYRGLDSLLGDDDHPQPTHIDHDAAEELAQRFRGALMQLVHRGLRDDAERDPEAARLIALARELRDEELPGGAQQALGLLRRLGAVTVELVDRLESMGIIEGVSKC